MRRAALLVGIFLAVLPGNSIRGVSQDELRQQIQDRQKEIQGLEAEIARYQNALEKQTGVSKTLKAAIARLELQIKKLNADIKLTQSHIQETQLKISDLGIQIDEKEKKIYDDEKSLGEIVRLIRETDDQTLLETLLVEDTLSNFFAEISSFENVGGGLADTLNTLALEKSDLEGQKNEQQKEKQSLIDYKNDLTGRKAAQESVNVTEKDLLHSSRNQESRYQILLAEREKQRALVQQELKSVEDQLRAQINPNLLPGKGRGVIGWPVENPIITQQFGFTDFAVTAGSDVYRGNGHNGVDFRASIGTRILAVEDGVVKDAGNTDLVCPGGSYGKYIIIEHQNNLSTLYGHLSSIIITKGQKVSRGQVIGYSGDTGYVTGPHLHFTVYASNTYQLHQTIHCGLIPAGGYLNPTDYL